MTTIMNLPIERTLAKRIKSYASRRKTSVSAIAENFFAVVIAQNYKRTMPSVSQVVKSFSIENLNIPDSFDYKKELEYAKNEKFL